MKTLDERVTELERRVKELEGARDRFYPPVYVQPYQVPNPQAYPLPPMYYPTTIPPWHNTTWGGS